MDILDKDFFHAIDGEKISLVFVDHDEDCTVQFVDSFGDISYAESEDDDGSIARIYVREVDSFPDIKLEHTDSFEDIEIFFEN